jgi:hypothetical protein
MAKDLRSFQALLGFPEVVVIFLKSFVYFTNQCYNHLYFFNTFFLKKFTLPR